MNKIKFAIDNFEIIKNDPSYMILQLDVVSDGENKHGTEFFVEDIIDSIPQISNKPINCTIQYGDFTDHAYTKEEEEKQLGVGVIPESNKATIVKKQGRNFLRVNAIVWKYLFPQAASILERRKNVSISMEITPVEIFKNERGIIAIKKWRYEAITLLGAYVNPAIENAQADVVKYSSNEEYFEDVLLNYGLTINKVKLPSYIVEDSERALMNKVNNSHVLNFCNKICENKEYTYDEIVGLNNSLVSIDKSDSTLDIESARKWFSKAIKEEGGNSMDKLKEALMLYFSDSIKYTCHDEEKVYCFDYDSVVYKAFNYSSEVVEDEVKLEVAEDFEEVIKVKDSYSFVKELEEGQEADDVIEFSIGKYKDIIEKEQNLSAELEDIKSKYSEKETEINGLSESIGKLTSEKEEVVGKITELEETIVGFSTLEEELTSLRDYRDNHEKEAKMTKVNALYSKYSEFLSSEELKVLNEKVDEMEISAFEKEVFSIVTPKIAEKLNILSAKETKTNGSESNLQYSTVPNVETEKDKDESDTLLSKIERI